MTWGRWLGAGWSTVALFVCHAVAQPVCPETASLTLHLENGSGSPAIVIQASGELIAGGTPCVGGGAASYDATLTCNGTGAGRCGRIDGLRPGRWIHRVTLSVPGSQTQEQAQETILLAGRLPEVSNVVAWTAFPRTFVVDTPSADAFHAALDAAGSWTAAHGGRALVTFSRAAFPGAADPRRIFLLSRPCAIDESRHRCTPDGATAGVCFTADGVVVDGLDHEARPGGVILSVDTCGRSLLRLYGADNVLRGLTFEGSRKPNPTGACQADTLAITGPRARRNRVEQVTVEGPTCGDATSSDHDAGQADADGAGDNVITGSRITGAADKGLKVDFGAHATIERTCLHDNRNGGIQSTLGGHVTAVENVVQRNLPGQAQNGLSAAGSTAESTLVTRANIVRFSGGRGLSVADNARGDFHDDYVADNQFAGAKVETTPTGPTNVIPAARFSGVAMACNRRPGLTGTCTPQVGDDERPCAIVEDCCTLADGTIDLACTAASTCTAGSFPRGFGLAVTQAPDHLAPDVQLGTADGPGRNAMVGNQNVAGGANLRVDATILSLPAEGNQWEHCGTTATCDTAAVTATDVGPFGVPVVLGMPEIPRAAALRIDAVTPGRPRAGDPVRILGQGFDAIDGNPTTGTPCADLVPCAPDGTCGTGPCVDGVCPCSIENPTVRARNLANQSSGGMRIRLLDPVGAVLTTLYPDAVTPTMLAFVMPFDCYAPLRVEVSKRDLARQLVVTSFPLCDVEGCSDRQTGAPCDDGNACTVDDRCDGQGRCVPGTALFCEGPCQACDPDSGCVPSPISTPCDDGNACTTADHCGGDANRCVGGPALACTEACAAGTCDPAIGCVAALPGTLCRTPVGPCDAAEHCTGSSLLCPEDQLQPRDVVCRESAGACDLPERCSGRTIDCPPDVRRQEGEICRPALDPCEEPEFCTGISPACPTTARDKVGFDAVACAFERDFFPDSCVGVRTPRPAMAGFEHARRAVLRAAPAGLRGQRHWLRVARRGLTSALKSLRNAAPGDCTTIRRSLLLDARERVISAGG